MRRGERLQRIAEARAANPGASIPPLFAHRYDVKAAYRVFEHPEVDPETVQSVHRAWVLEQVARAGTFLRIEDTTQLDWTGRAPRPGLGPLGDHRAGTPGVVLHSGLAVRGPDGPSVNPQGRRPRVEVMGLADQQYHRRQPWPSGAARQPWHARKKRTRESQRWVRASERLGSTPSGVGWVRVGDAEADIYEPVQACQAKGHGYVIRSGQDRALVASGESRTVVGHLHERLRQASALGDFAVKLYARPQQPVRTAKLSVSAVPVWLRAPQRSGAAPGGLPPLACTAVRVWEATPPARCEALEWILLCDAPVTTFTQAREWALQYARRWLIEEFHKAWKTGLGVERLQLETARRLGAAAAIMSVVARRLVGLREQVRIDPQGSATEAGLDQLSLAVLGTAAQRPLQTKAEVALAIGRLGGHLNRTQDGLPGWHSRWLGMRKLDLLVEGVRLAPTISRFG